MQLSLPQNSTPTRAVPLANRGDPVQVGYGCVCAFVPEPAPTDRRTIRTRLRFVRQGVWGRCKEGQRFTQPTSYKPTRQLEWLKYNVCYQKG